LGLQSAAGYHEWAAFGAQQSAKKAVKALVQFLDGSQRGHSISGILEQLPASVEVPGVILDAARERSGPSLHHGAVPKRLCRRRPGGLLHGEDERPFVEPCQRGAAALAKQRLPEIARVFLFGSLVQGNWTADSDADLIVVVRKDFPSVLDRSPYHIHAKSILTDTLVFSEAEFEQLSGDPASFLSRNLPSALEL
jgi:HEPN domain-containing protein/predicted nucleotidyltransferase